jgi:membrane-associated phospholipid phosphatase
LIALGIIWQTDVKLFVIMAILIAGLTGSARIKLNAHTPAQVYTGFAAGLLPQLLLALFIFH